MTSRIALYARVSSDKQAEERTIESQLARLKEYAAEKKYAIDKKLVFADNGVSGATLIRPQLEKLRDAAFTGQIERVLVLCPDRLARKHAHQLILVEELSRLNVEIEYANHAITKSPEDQLLLQIQGVISEFEREKIMERSRRGKLYQAKQQRVAVLSSAPYGYTYVAKHDGADARYEIDAKQAEVVRKVFWMYANKNASTEGIAKWLTENDVPTPNGGAHWSSSTIKTMLKNPAYMGQAAYRKTYAAERSKITKLARDRNHYPKAVKSSRLLQKESEWLFIPVPKIVDEALFRKVREKTTFNRKFSSRNNKRNSYLLTGLLRCAECGYALSGTTTGKENQRRSYYACIGQKAVHFHGEKKCRGHYLRAELLEELVWEQTKKLIEEPQLMFAEYGERTNQKSTEQQTIESLIAKKKQELRRLDLQQDKILDCYQEGLLSKEKTHQRLEAIKQRATKVTSEHTFLENTARKEYQQLQLIEQFSSFRETFSSNINSLSFEQKRDVLRLLVNEISVDCSTGKITIKHVVPLPKKHRLRTDRVV